ncbi:MAG: B12-binding domain-containing protein [Deltaproteobacteria bacterium]|nr:B12-binding domain-containing protein [Deltaproteobacteria bacterium]
MELLERALLALNGAEVLGLVDAVIERTGVRGAQQAVEVFAAALQIVRQRFQDGEWLLGELVYAGGIAKKARQKLSLTRGGSSLRSRPWP